MSALARRQLGRSSSVVASWVLAGGVLTGKYAVPRAPGRMAAELDNPRLTEAQLAELRLIGAQQQ